MTREDMLATINKLYEARIEGDFGEMHHLVTEDSTFAFGGDNRLIEGMPGVGDDLKAAARSLHEGVRMLKIELQESVAEDYRLAALWKARVQFGKCEPFDTMIYNLWDFAEDGRISGLIEFIDTARAQEAMREAAALTA